MQEKLASIGDHSLIEDDQGDRVYTVDGKALRARHTFVLEDRDDNGGDDHSARGNTVDHEYEVKRDGDVIATASKSSSLSLDTPQKAST